MNISIEDLKEYRWTKQEIKSIEAEIESLYRPIHSPSGNTSGSRSSLPGDPTASAVGRIEYLKQRRDDLQKDINRVDTWLLATKSRKVAAICRWHYVLGKTWDVTSYEVYGYYTKDTARHSIERFFETKYV